MSDFIKSMLYLATWNSLLLSWEFWRYVLAGVGVLILWTIMVILMGWLLEIATKR